MQNSVRKVENKVFTNNEKQNLGHHGKTVRYLFGVKAPRKLPVVAPSVKA